MARIGGAFNLPIAQTQEGTSAVVLYGGATYNIPPGEYFAQTPSNGQVEWFDGQSQSWRIYMEPSSGGPFSVDGYNYRLHNLTGTVTATTISNAGSGMTNGIGSTATGVSLGVAAPGTANYQTALLQPIIGGSVQAPTVTQGGSGFLVPPVVVIDPPPLGGIQANAYATLGANGAVASITMSTVGAGYTASPNFYLIPQPPYYQGSPIGATPAASIPAPGLVYPSNAIAGNQNTSANGAQLTSNALTGSGTLTGITVVAAGSGYLTGSPTVTFTGGAGGVAATVTIGTTTLATSVFFLQPRVQ